MARFAIPAGTAAGLGVLSAYNFALNVVQLPLIEARTTATTTLVILGLYFVLVLEASTTRRAFSVGMLCALLFAAYVVVLAYEPTRSFFALAWPGIWGIVAVAGGSLLAIAGLTLTDERFVPEEIRRRVPRTG